MTQYTLAPDKVSTPAGTNRHEVSTARGPNLIYRNDGGLAQVPRYFALRPIIKRYSDGTCQHYYEVGTGGRRILKDRIDTLRAGGAISLTNQSARLMLRLKPSTLSEAYHSERIPA